MPNYAFTPVRTTRPDPETLLTAVRSACGDAAAIVLWMPPVFVKKAADWTAPEIAAVQAAIEAAPVLTDQKAAQLEIDKWPLALKALVLALIDQINVLRTQAGLSIVTPAQALAAIRSKAATL